MAEIKFECFECGQHIAVEHDYAKQYSNCPQCFTPIQIPQLSFNDDKFNNAVVMKIGTVSWDYALAQLKSIQNRTCENFALVSSSNKFLSVTRHEYYVVEFGKIGIAEDCLRTISTSLPFKTIIEIFENFFDSQKVDFKKVRWQQQVNDFIDSTQEDIVPDEAISLLLNDKPCYSLGKISESFNYLRSHKCDRIELKSKSGDYIVIEKKDSWQNNVSVRVNKKVLTFDTMPVDYIESVFCNILQADGNFSQVQIINDWYRKPRRKRRIFPRKEVSCNTYSYSPQTFSPEKSDNLSCGQIIIILLSLIIFIIILNTSSCSSSSSSNAGGYKCNGCSTAWSPTPFPGGYCTKCSDGGCRPLMEKFAERLIKEETGLDSDVRLEKNNGRYEYKVRYK